ncbi:hypothetical protein BDN72DRAFT_905981 [Pluteus cervinus]|uniref:Uncharacterized protein n=1 Tax=Pluteus cervinus TaxID=181527 RepID=A0ACD3A1K5_9AGAR|nr:hypothetical protein BDN72DRAFT_905981 [Pluteus cervinus]
MAPSPSPNVTATSGADSSASPRSYARSDPQEHIYMHLFLAQSIIGEAHDFEGELREILLDEGASNLPQEWQELHKNTISLCLELDRMERTLKSLQKSYMDPRHEKVYLPVHDRILKRLRRQSLCLRGGILACRNRVIPALRRSIPISIRQFCATLPLQCMAMVSVRPHPVLAFVIGIALYLVIIFTLDSTLPPHPGPRLQLFMNTTINDEILQEWGCYEIFWQIYGYAIEEMMAIIGAVCKMDEPKGNGEAEEYDSGWEESDNLEEFAAWCEDDDVGDIGGDLDDGAWVS